ncbi:MAG: Fic family protein [bacterium]
MINKSTPYNSLPFLPPPKDIDLESKNILKKLVSAKEKLAELKGYSELLPNKNIILSIIVLQESKDSSEIENIVTTYDELYISAVLGKKIISPRAKEVLNYRKALYKGLELIDKNKLLTVNSIIEIQKNIMDNDAGIRKLPGTKLINDLTKEVRYTPPDNGKAILDLLKNLEEYINNDIYGGASSTDPLIKSAVIHYQFEAIHPFYDGNGRTGRIIIVLYLILKGLLNEPFLYVSRYIIGNKARYYKLLHDVTYKNKWEDWIIFILDSVECTSKDILKMSKSIINLINKTDGILKYNLPKIYSKELINLIFSNVYIKINDLVENKIASRNIASKYLSELYRINILQKQKIGKENIYINTELFNLIKSL